MHIHRHRQNDPRLTAAEIYFIVHTIWTSGTGDISVGLALRSLRDAKQFAPLDSVLFKRISKLTDEIIKHNIEPGELSA